MRVWKLWFENCGTSHAYDSTTKIMDSVSPELFSAFFKECIFIFSNYFSSLLLQGNLQIFLDDFPLMQSGLTMSQRIFYSSCGYNYFCAAISIPFFQLVPSWAIFFGLWPVSKIGLEFAFTFFVYYSLGNLLLLFPPPGFQVKDMWNGELASTNLWFTYFNGVRRIVGTKLMQGWDHTPISSCCFSTLLTNLNNDWLS